MRSEQQWPAGGARPLMCIIWENERHTQVNCQSIIIAVAMKSTSDRHILSLSCSCINSRRALSSTGSDFRVVFVVHSAILYILLLHKHTRDRPVCSREKLIRRARWHYLRTCSAALLDDDETRDSTNVIEHKKIEFSFTHKSCVWCCCKQNESNKIPNGI